MTTVVRLVVVPTILAGVATLLWPWTERTDRRRRIATAPVVVAAEEIPEGRIIAREAVRIALWPVPTIPAGA